MNKSTQWIFFFWFSLSDLIDLLLVNFDFYFCGGFSWKNRTMGYSLLLAGTV